MREQRAQRVSGTGCQPSLGRAPRLPCSHPAPAARPRAKQGTGLSALGKAARERCCRCSVYQWRRDESLRQYPPLGAQHHRKRGDCNGHLGTGRKPWRDNGWSVHCSKCWGDGLGIPHLYTQDGWCVNLSLTPGARARGGCARGTLRRAGGGRGARKRWTPRFDLEVVFEKAIHRPLRWSCPLSRPRRL